MNTRKIIAYAILMIAYLVPFNYAYFTPPDTGRGTLTGFLFVILGTAIFTAIMFREELRQEREG